ncbi:MAG: type III-A CRISPR-associated RAMP protein Csm5 [Geminicoccaceae bacterium]|nr:type III-A CRISPR-associated RAMP protein Csm5 [Geminicoccaceae bacterium]
MQGDVTWRLTAVPLTPIHVGDGSVLAAEEWRLTPDGAWLERFEPAAVLRAADPRRRREYLENLERGQLQAAQRILRESVPPGLVLERIAVGAAASAQLRPVVENPLRRGDVRPMVRTGGRPYLPGSSLKGALRTALLSSLVPAKTAAIEAIKGRHRTPKGTIASRASNEVQALLLEHQNPDQDPFRFVEVADIALPERSTRVDQVINWRPARLIRNGQQPAEKMQMIFEVTNCAALGNPLPLPCEIRIEAGALREARSRDREQRKTPGFKLDAQELARAVVAFHWKLWDHELGRFFAGETSIEKTLKSLVRVKAPDGTLLGPEALRGRSDVLLLRLGRFGQFESKSLEGVREGWNAQAKPPHPMKEGNTRNLVRPGGTAPLLPLGWLLLLPEGFELQRAPAAATAASAGPRAAAPGPARRAFYAGEEVRVRKRERGEVLIEFPGGDTEWVDESELEWR